LRVLVGFKKSRRFHAPLELLSAGRIVRLDAMLPIHPNPLRPIFAAKEVSSVKGQECEGAGGANGT
jgi:hypothetical protein